MSLAYCLEASLGSPLKAPQQKKAHCLLSS
jgi:hypothetical protein